MTLFEQTLSEKLTLLGISHDAALLGRCNEYFEHVNEANQHLNLTRITDAAQAAEQHFADAMALCAVFDMPKGCRVIDIGTGAGFPGVPLKLLRNDIQLWLLDASGKKTDFIKKTRDVMSMAATVLCDRAEELAQTDLRGSFDVVVSRAVASLPMLLELSIPLLRIGGTLAAWKGESFEQELTAATSAMNTLGCILASQYPVGRGAILLIQKQKPTLNVYPRRFSKIKSQPL